MIRRLLVRFDRLALPQLCEVSARLAAENDDLRRELYNAQDDAEFRREQALAMQEQLAESAGGVPGITQSGQLVYDMLDDTQRMR